MALWNEHLSKVPRIMFQKILQTARENKDDILAKKLIEVLKNTPVITQGALGNAYSCLLDLLVTNGKIEELFNKFEEAIQNVSIDNINRTAVLKVKEVYEKEGRYFDKNIPDRKKNNRIEKSESE